MNRDPDKALPYWMYQTPAPEERDSRTQHGPVIVHVKDGKPLTELGARLLKTEGSNV
jgi:hypothetical protein